MALFRTSNPAFKRLENSGRQQVIDQNSEAASYGGIAAKSAYFVILTFIAAAASFYFSLPLAVSNPQLAYVLLGAAFITAFISSLVALFAPGTTKVAGTVYAVAEGLTVGFISLAITVAFEGDANGKAYGGIVLAALMSTIGVFAIMTFLYAKGIIRVGSNFKRFMISALIGAIVMNLLMWLLSLVSPELNTIFYGTGLFAVAVSIIMVVLASLMILLDLNRMTEFVENGMDKKYEWFAAFGLLLTLVWLYLEFLKLFAIIADRK